MRFLFAFLMLCGAGLSAQAPPPGAIRLLPGYVHKAAAGKDSGKAGTIGRPQGPQIEYRFGMKSKLAPVFDPPTHAPELLITSDDDGPQMIHEATNIAGRPVRFFAVPAKNHSEAEVFFTRDKLGFRAKYADMQQLAEILLITLSYPLRPGQPGFERLPFRRIKLEEDPPNTIITHGRFTHTLSTDSSGSIRQAHQPEIQYQVGAPPDPLPEWTLQQRFIGHPITVSYGTRAGGTTPSLQIVFLPQPGSDADPVTFRAYVRNDREFVEALMTVLAYHQ